MKQKIPTPLAGVIIVVCTAGVLFSGWKWMGATGGANSDVRPMIKVMNFGKPSTEPIAAGDDLLLAGGRSVPKPENSKKAADDQSPEKEKKSKS